MPTVNADNCGFCYLDVDIDGYRAKLATAAAFVNATNSRYGFSSSDLLSLGGSEVSRIPELIETDHEWSLNSKACGGIVTKPPSCGNRMILRLFWDVAPMACENFATLCGNGSLLPGETGKAKPAPLGESGKPLSYRNVTVHRVVPGFVMQSGDFVFGNGSGGESIFGKKFKDERAGLQQKHDRRGVLAMGNSGKNSNSSQFFITFDKALPCDGKHVVFGELISGFEILDAVERLGSSGGEPSVPITITDCGIYTPLWTQSCGFWYDKPDADSFSGISPVFIVRPRVALLVPCESVQKKFSEALEDSACIVSAIYTDVVPSAEEQSHKISKLLAIFASDVIIVAPACWRHVQTVISLPSSWTRNGITLNEVVLVSKPVEAKSNIQAESWLYRRRSQWHLDGNH
jgi:peptidylprolyl isomerase